MPNPAALVEELTLYRQARADGELASAWTALDRAHILGQMDCYQHARVHLLMLGLGIDRGAIVPPAAGGARVGHRQGAAGQ